MTKIYGATSYDIAFGEIEYQLFFKDIIETEDGWIPIEKGNRNPRECKAMRNRNDSMRYKKGNNND